MLEENYLDMEDKINFTKEHYKKQYDEQDDKKTN